MPPVSIPARLTPATLAILSILGLAGCQEPSTEAPPPPLVLVAPVAERTVTDHVVFTGRTEAAQTVDVRARVSGYLTQVAFRDGQVVKRGDLLFLIDPRPYQADLNRAQARLDAAKAELQLASIEYTRAKELRAKNTISAQDFDAKAASYLKAQAGQASAQADYDTAALNLEFTRITAPIDGMTSKASVTPGNLVTPQLQQPLTTIVSVNPVYAYADLDERLLLKYLRLNNSMAAARGEKPQRDSKPERTPVQLQLTDEKDFPHTGYIDFADNRINRGTGTISVRAVFQDEDNLLGPGMFVRLRFPASMPYQALLVPQEAIGIDQGQRYVFVVTAEGTVDYRRVEPGALQDDGWQVVTGSLKAGEQVIVEGLMKVRPGQKVETEPWSGASAPPTPQATPSPTATPAPASQP